MDGQDGERLHPQQAGNGQGIVGALDGRQGGGVNGGGGRGGGGQDGHGGGGAGGGGDRLREAHVEVNGGRRGHDLHGVFSHL